ncbi:MAG: nuclear transport factor 2 family protein [Sandarakinorhabdus sp.]|nr:nuclear transport factor 2 family protein [Sandarakinorhabdus sp.]
MLAPLAAALGDFDVRTDLRIRGAFDSGDWLASSGHIAGHFGAPLFGIPPTAGAVFLRFGRFDRLVAGAVADGPASIAETILLLDLPALMLAAGCWPLGAPLGPTVVAPGPRDHKGLDPVPDAVEGAKSLALVEALIAALKRYDGADLASMGMRDLWTTDFWWFGPAPIGSFRGHGAYETGHQGPFLRAFPDRVGGNHRCRIGDGRFVASTGWPSINATHSGGDWLGLPATNKRITMRVMDFWGRDGDRLDENWVMIDIPDLLMQMGVDVFARMAVLAGNRK